MPISALRPLVVLGLVALAALSSADAQTDSRLVGSWEAVRVLNADGEETMRSNESATMTFTDDGRLLIGLKDNTSDQTMKVSYQVVGDAIAIVNETGEEARLFFRFEGDELVLTPEDGPDETAYLRRVPE